MREYGQLSKRVKGLIGIILSVAMFMCMGDMRVYALELSSSEGIIGGAPEYLNNRETVSINSGGVFYIDSEFVPAGTDKYSAGGVDYYKSVSLSVPAGYKLKLNSCNRRSETIPRTTLNIGSGEGCDNINVYDISVTKVPFKVTFSHIGFDLVKENMIPDADGNITLPTLDETGGPKMVDSNFIGWSREVGAPADSPGTKIQLFGDHTFTAKYSTTSNGNNAVSADYYYLEENKPYTMSESLSVGDGCTYASGVTFYVPSTSNYRFSR